MTGEPKGVRHHNVCMPGTLDQVGQGRRVLLGCLGEDHPRVDDAVLMASETMTNALVHTMSGAAGGHFVLTVQWTGEWARVTVTDQGSATVPTRVAAAGTATTGRGIDLIDTLADRWGFIRERSGSRVWFDVSTGPDQWPPPALCPKPCEVLSASGRAQLRDLTSLDRPSSDHGPDAA